MSPEVEGLVESSNNIAKVELKEGKLRVLNLSRSSVDSTKMAVADRLRASFELAGLDVAFTGCFTRDGSLTLILKLYRFLKEFILRNLVNNHVLLHVTQD